MAWEIDASGLNLEEKKPPPASKELESQKNEKKANERIAFLEQAGSKITNALFRFRQGKNDDTVPIEEDKYKPEPQPKPQLEPQQETQRDQVVIPADFLLMGDAPGGQKGCLNIKDLCDRVMDEKYNAILVLATSPGYLDTIKEIRRKINLSSLPVVVLLSPEQTLCYSYGADECLDKLDYPDLERIRARTRQLREMWAKAVKDDLTGLYKRQFINEYIDEQTRHFNETGVGFSVALLDLDKFKSINDTYGHEAGDTLLKEFSGFLTKSLRQLDLVSRWGGDEFLIVFPRTGPREAVGVMERLKSSWDSVSVTTPVGENIHVSFSAGIASYTPGINIVTEADKLLYEAKAAGKTAEPTVKEVIGSRRKTLPPEIQQRPFLRLPHPGCRMLQHPWLLSRKLSCRLPRATRLLLSTATSKRPRWVQE